MTVQLLTDPTLQSKYFLRLQKGHDSRTASEKKEKRQEEGETEHYTHEEERGKKKVEREISYSLFSRYGIKPFKAYWLRDAQTSLTFNNCTLCPHCIYVFCIYLRTKSDLCHLQHKLIGFYNPDEKCLQRGTNWVFK